MAVNQAMLMTTSAGRTATKALVGSSLLMKDCSKALVARKAKQIDVNLFDVMSFAIDLAVKICGSII